MRAFACPHCGALVFFENSVCLTCGSALGFYRPDATLVMLRPGTDSGLVYLAPDGTVWQPCANLTLASCNWLAEANAADGLCSSCALTRTRPADDDQTGLREFNATEVAKRRLVYQLDALGLPTTPRSVDPARGLAFDLLSSARLPVVTGHDSGVITIDLAEGNDSHRERMRVELDEPYRTLLGHLRHETGHWYWEVLVDGSPHLDGFRRLFGDDRRDYVQALQEHYGKPDSGGWVDDYVSHYAAAHPWEDWAETFAHYLHIHDTIQTAAAWGTRVDGPRLALNTAAPVSAEPGQPEDAFADIINTWLPLTFALNAINRSMGYDNLYPFVLSPTVLEKLRFVHDRITT
jgi:hypothetical protein